MSVSPVTEKVMHGWMGRGWKRRPTGSPRQSFTLQTPNALNKLPKSVQPRAKADLKEIWMAEGRDDAGKAFGRFLAKYHAKYDKAADCLAKDRETLLAFYDFPAEHWKHIRTGNPIESTFATVRHRTVRSKGCLSYETAKIMVFKMIIEGIKFTGGIETVRDHAAA